MLAKLYPFKNNQAFVWYLLFIVATIEFYLFCTHVTHNLAKYYPASFDQSDYLLMAYRIYEHIKTEGFLTGLANSEMLHNGILFLIQAVGLFFVFGANRLSALLPNLFYFLLLQIITLYSLRSLTKKNYFSLIFLGLILSIKTPFAFAGSLFDFRMDFIAFCLYGTLASSIIKSRIFIDKKWSIIAGIIACLMILLRCITVVYVAILLGSLFSYFIYGLIRHRSTEKQHIKTQLTNLIFASLIIAAAVFPYLWLNKEYIYNYYVSTHVISQEKYIRVREVGITNQLAFFTFYPLSLISDHLGNKTTFGAVIFLLVNFFLYSVRNKYKLIKHCQTMTSINWQDGFIFLLLITLIPLLILTLDTSKSPVVGSISAIPFLWLIIWTCLYLNQFIRETKTTKLVFNILTVSILLYGLSHQIIEFRHHNSKFKQQQLTTITKMYQDIVNYAATKNWQDVQLSVDQINDYLIPSAIADVYYETNNKLINAYLEGLGSNIFPISKEDALKSLQNSNVIIFNLGKYPFSVYPFNQTIYSIKPKLLNYANKHFTRLGEYHFFNSTYRVYVANDKKIKA